jgi:hypothetical protein
MIDYQATSSCYSSRPEPAVACCKQGVALLFVLGAPMCIFVLGVAPRPYAVCAGIAQSVWWYAGRCVVSQGSLQPLPYIVQPGMVTAAVWLGSWWNRFYGPLPLPGAAIHAGA